MYKVELFDAQSPWSDGMSQTRQACYADITNPSLKNAINSHCLSTVQLASLGNLFIFFYFIYTIFIEGNIFSFES